MPLLANAARRDVSPRKPVFLCGFPYAERNSGLHTAEVIESPDGVARGFHAGVGGFSRPGAAATATVDRRGNHETHNRSFAPEAGELLVNTGLRLIRELYSG